ISFKRGLLTIIEHIACCTQEYHRRIILKTVLIKPRRICGGIDIKPIFFSELDQCLVSCRNRFMIKTCCFTENQYLWFAATFVTGTNANDGKKKDKNKRQFASNYSTKLSHVTVLSR